MIITKKISVYSEFIGSQSYEFIFELGIRKTKKIQEIVSRKNKKYLQNLNF